MDKKYKEVETLLAGLPKSGPPEDFTGRVMDALPERYNRKPGFYYKIQNMLVRQRQYSFGKTISPAVCFPCFVLAAFFYFILGVSTIMGLKMLSGQMAFSSWIMLQPHIAFINAMSLIGMGSLMRKQNMFAANTVRISLWLYMIFTVFNGFFIQKAFGIPLTSMIVVLFIGCGVLVGFFLTDIVKTTIQLIKNNGEINEKNCI